jgi:hypothetical protein
MIKAIVSFVKNLFGSKEPQQPEQQAPAAWPFPTSVPEDGPVVTQTPVEVSVPEVPAPEANAPKIRKRRNPRKKVTSAATTTTAVATPVEPTKEEVKLSPGPSRRRKSKK